MKSLKEFSFVCSLSPFRRRLADLLGSVIGQKPRGVAARRAMQRSLPHCTALSTFVAVSAFYDDHDIPAT